MTFGVITFFLSFFLLTLSEAKHNKSFGGKIAHDGQFPYMAALYVNGMFCGASIIHQRWALTAAHCIFEFNETWSWIQVGSVERKGPSIIHKIQNFYTHPDYVNIPEDKNNDTIEYVVNDIGLIRLTSNVTFNDKVQPITLATDEGSSYENSIATVPSWGTAGGDTPVPDFLHYINVRVLTHEECQRAWPYADKHICTSTQEKQGTCNGDSGSPLVIGGVQIGITSTGDTYCESLKPNLFTKVVSFIPWIKSIMSRHGDALPDS